jgi:hypothetical protein
MNDGEATSSEKGSQRSFVPMRNFRVVPFRLWLILGLGVIHDYLRPKPEGALR